MGNHNKVFIALVIACVAVFGLVAILPYVLYVQSALVERPVRVDYERIAKKGSNDVFTFVDPETGVRCYLFYRSGVLSTTASLDCLEGP